MSTGNPARLRAASAATRPRSRRRSLLGGGIDGNEQLTAITGALLIVLFAVLGVTILRIGQLISIHLFVGFMLLGPVALKLASTGYRFMRYYGGNAVYREKGPPHPLLRGLAPLLVADTLVVFATGVVLMFLGPADRDPFLLLHKASFILWLGLTGLHVLGHLPGLDVTLRGAVSPAGSRYGTAGGTGRWLALAGALVAGLVLAIVLIPDFAAWTAHGGFFHHHDG